MAKVVPQDIGLVITRAGRDDARRVEVLLSQRLGALPTSPLTKDEHPCEAAWRLAKATLGTKECVAYRALGGPDASGRQWFQTACEEDLPELVFGPDGEPHTWQAVDDMAAALPATVKSVLIR
jgi:hypothetical protein